MEFFSPGCNKGFSKKLILAKFSYTYSCYAVVNETAGKAGVSPALADFHKQLQAGRLVYP